MAIGENVITIIIKNVKFNLIKKYYTLTEQTYICICQLRQGTAPVELSGPERDVWSD